MDIHPDVTKFAKWVSNIDRSAEVVEHTKIVTWEKATNFLFAIYVLDSTFKMVLPGGEIIGYNKVDMNGEREGAKYGSFNCFG